MKNLFLLAITMLTLACSKDDDCNATSAATAIVGEWTVHALGQSFGSVEFFADGTFSDPADALIGGDIQGEPLSVKTYAIIHAPSYDVLEVNAATEDGSGSFSLDYDVLSYACNEFVIDAIGIETKLRK